MPSVSAYARSKKIIDKVMLKTDWIEVRQKNFGWAEMRIKNYRTGEVDTFNVRPSMVNKAIRDARKSQWSTPAGNLYSVFVNETVKGRLYTDRRQVEGILKVALDTQDETLIAKVTEVLKHSDSFISNWYRNVWLKEMSNTELEVFYEGSDDSIESELAAMGVVFDEE